MLSSPPACGGEVELRILTTLDVGNMASNRKTFRWLRAQSASSQQSFGNFGYLTFVPPWPPVCPKNFDFSGQTPPNKPNSSVLKAGKVMTVVACHEGHGFQKQQDVLFDQKLSARGVVFEKY